MDTKKSGKGLDILLVVLMILPVLFCVVLSILFKPASDGIEVNGALVYATIPMPLQDLYITEAQINSWAVVISLFFLCLFLTRRLSVKHPNARQHLAEWIVEKLDSLVSDNMGEYFKSFAPFIGAIIGLSAFSSLLSLVGQFAPTSDMSVVAGWAILVFIFITYYKLKCGILYYLKGYTEPVFILAPINVIGEFATPISMAFRHYGNILSGLVISILVSAGLSGLSVLALGWLPGMLGEIPFLRVGIPAVLSIYFDVFSGCLQAFIFAMLTMMNISGAFPEEDYFARKARKAAKKAKAAK